MKRKILSPERKFSRDSDFLKGRFASFYQIQDFWLGLPLIVPSEKNSWNWTNASSVEISIQDLITTTVDHPIFWVNGKKKKTIVFWESYKTEIKILANYGLG